MNPKTRMAVATGGLFRTPRSPPSGAGHSLPLPLDNSSFDNERRRDPSSFHARSGGGRRGPGGTQRQGTARPPSPTPFGSSSRRIRPAAPSSGAPVFFCCFMPFQHPSPLASAPPLPPLASSFFGGRCRPTVGGPIEFHSTAPHPAPPSCHPPLRSSHHLPRITPITQNTALILHSQRYDEPHIISLSHDTHLTFLALFGRFQFLFSLLLV